MDSIKAIESNNVKEDIRARIDMAQVVGRYVKLKSSGSNYKGLCPFHKEKTPSFTVSPDKGIFYCFGCGKGGDIYSFLMEIEGLTFQEALQRMADETGVVIPSFSKLKTTLETNIKKADALRIHNTMSIYYYHRMKENQVAIDYFKSRGILPETVRDFCLGYAPEGWQNLINFAKSEGISEEQLSACGLTISSSTGKDSYDRFRNRIIFPIFDISGRPVAFAGRGIDKNAKPKYINSPETILYRKNRILYGLHRARDSIKERGFAIFVEGYMDFLALFQAGIKNVIATSGTALTEEHGSLIHRFTSEVVLVFDGDSAGTQAAERAVFILIPQNLNVKILLLPENEDPDSYLKKHGKNAFIQLVQNSLDAIEYILHRAKEKYDFNSAVGKAEIVEYIIKLLQSVADTIVQSELIKKVAESLDVREELLYTKLREKNYRITRAKKEEIVYNRNIEHFLETEEGSFLHILVKEPFLIDFALKHTSVDFFSEIFSRNLYSYIIDSYKLDKSLKNIVHQCKDEEIKKLLSLMLIKEIAAQDYKEDLFHKAKRFSLKLNKKRIHEINRKMRKEHNPEEIEKLFIEQKKLSIQRGELLKQ